MSSNKKKDWIYFLIPLIVVTIVIYIVVIGSLDVINIHQFDTKNQNLFKLNGTPSKNIAQLESIVITPENKDNIDRYAIVLNSRGDPFTLQYPGLDLNLSNPFTDTRYQIEVDPRIIDWELSLENLSPQPQTVYVPEINSNVPTNPNSGSQYYTNASGINDTVSIIVIENRIYKIKNESLSYLNGVTSGTFPVKMYIRFDSNLIMSLPGNTLSNNSTLLLGYGPKVIVTKDLKFSDYRIVNLSEIQINDTNAINAIPTSSSAQITTIEQKKSLYISTRVDNGDIVIVPPYRDVSLYNKYAYYLGSSPLQNIIYDTPTGFFDTSNGTYLIINVTQDQFFEMGIVQ